VTLGSTTTHGKCEGDITAERHDWLETTYLIEMI